MKKSSIAAALASVVAVGLTAPSWAAEHMQSGDSQAQPMHQSQITAINPADYTNKVITTHKGQTFGTINSLVSRDRDQDVYALVDVTPSLGLGADQVVIPIRQLEPQGDKWMVASDVTSEQVRNQMLYDPAQFSAFEMSDRANAAEQQAAATEQRPEEAQARPAEPVMVPAFSAVLFDTDKSDLSAEGFREVTKVADYMKANPDRHVQILGHTDSTGAEEYNQALSEDRAAAVKTMLIRQGIDPSRIDIRGYGESSAVAANSTAGGRQLNRRAETVISVEQGGMQAAAGSEQQGEPQTQPMTEPQTAAINPGDYTGKVIETANGQTVGTIGSLIRKDSDEDVYALVDVAPGLGLGADRVVVPINHLEARGDKWMLSSDLTNAQARSQMLYDPAEFSAFELTDQPSMNK